jgi:hypothetical protein
MGKATSVRGLWRIEGEEKEPTPGTLSIDSDSIILLVWKPVNISYEDMMLEMVGDRSFKMPEVIIGTDGDNKPVTLFGCGINSHSISGGLKSWDIHAIAAVQGLKVDAWSQPIARAVRIEFEYLNRWYGRNLSSREITDEKKLSLTLGDFMDLEFTVEPGVRLRFVEHASYSHSEDEQKITSQSSIWFQFQDLQSLAEITAKWLPWIRSLLGLLIGVAIKNTSVELFPEDPYEPRKPPLRSGVLLMPKDEGRGRPGSRAPDSRSMVAAFEPIRGQLGSVLAGWNRVYTELRPVVDLFSSVAFHHALYNEARFLFLVQALEIYHSRSPRFVSTEMPRDQHQQFVKKAKTRLPQDMWKWAQGKLSMNFCSLRKKLTDIFKEHRAEGERLFGDITTAVARIAYTRNHLTHHSDESKRGRLMSEMEIAAAGWKLEALLWAILLREVGLDGSPVDRVVGRAANIEFVGMERS